MKKLSFVVLWIILFGIPNISHAATILDGVEINPTPGIGGDTTGGYLTKAICENNLTGLNTVCCAKYITVYTCPTCTTISNQSLQFTKVNDDLCHGASGSYLGTAGTYRILYTTTNTINEGQQQRWFPYMSEDQGLIDGASCYQSANQF